MHPEPRQPEEAEFAPWLRLAFDCGPEQIDAAAELLDRFGATAVSIAPRDEALMADRPGRIVYGARNRVSALLAGGTQLDILIACLRNRVGADNVLDVAFEPVADRDWSAEGRAAFGPISFRRRLCICPSWARPVPGLQAVMLDPGLAFGTGTHATTALCLDWLTGAVREGMVVIDYGCGSGVLGLSAAVLGAREVHAVDVDPEALNVARENAAKNRLSERVRVSHPDGELPAADILVANILLQPLVDLAPTFGALVKPGGRIALSGILAAQAEDCASAHRRWFDLGVPEFRDEWALLHGVRKPAPALGSGTA